MIDESKLRPWQVPAAKHLLEILRHHDSALDCSDTGTGKTYTALAVAKALQLPCLAVVPKIAITGWLAVAEHFNEKISAINYELLRTGTTPYGTWANYDKGNAGRSFVFFCIYCQCRYTEGDPGILCPANEHGVCCLERKTRPIVRGAFQFNKAVKFIVWDEAHRAGGMNSLNSKMLIACKKARIKHLLLSATPAQSPLQMKAIGHSLDLFSI